MSRHKALYNSAEWSRLRADALDRDDHRCSTCGSTARLSVHHVIPVTDAPDRALDLDNVETLCRRCHGHEDGYRAHAPKPKRANRFIGAMRA